MNDETVSPAIDENGFFHSMEYQFKLYQTMVESTSDISAIISKDYTLQAVSDGYLELLGLEWDKALGFSLETLHGSKVFEKDLQRTIIDTYERGECHVELVIDFPKSGTHILDLKFKPVEVLQDGNVNQLCLIVGRDVTELRTQQKKLEETRDKLNSILENLPGCIYRCVSSGSDSIEYSYISIGVSKLLGYDLDQVMEAPHVLFRAIHPEDMEGFMEAFNHSVENKVPFVYEYRVLRQGGEYTWVRDISNPQLQEDGSTAWNALLLDITEQKELEIQLIQASKLESVGQLACGIAHEINTPSQFVADNLRFLQDSFKDLLEVTKLAVASSEVALSENIDKDELEFLQEEIPDAISQSIDGVNRVSQIVSAMKFFAHPGTEVKSNVDIVSILKDAAAISCNSWKYCSILEVVSQEDEILVPCFPAELGQVIVNLIVNAAHAIEDRFGEEKKGQITIMAEQRDDAVNITIEDNGCGITDEVKARLFEPFFTTKEMGRGTGQGLAIAQKIIINDHHGDISLDSKVGEGSRFEISIPLKGSVPENEEEESSPAEV